MSGIHEHRYMTRDVADRRRHRNGVVRTALLLVSAYVLVATLQPSAEPRLQSPDTGRPGAPASSEARDWEADLSVALETERDRVRSLRARLATAPDEAGALRLQREVEEVLRDTELRLLQAQTARALREGQLELDRAIRDRIFARNDIHRGQPRPRPATR